MNGAIRRRTSVRRPRRTSAVAWMSEALALAILCWPRRSSWSTTACFSRGTIETNGASPVGRPDVGGPTWGVVGGRRRTRARGGSRVAPGELDRRSGHARWIQAHDSRRDGGSPMTLDRSKVWTGSVNDRCSTRSRGRRWGCTTPHFATASRRSGSSWPPDEKLEIARALDAAGIDRIEAGFRGSLTRTLEAVRTDCGGRPPGPRSGASRARCRPTSTRSRSSAFGHR